MAAKPKTIDEYLAALSDDKHPTRLQYGRGVWPTCAKIGRSETACELEVRSLNRAGANTLERPRIACAGSHPRGSPARNVSLCPVRPVP